MPAPQARRWCFTLNNPSDDECIALKNLFPGESHSHLSIPIVFFSFPFCRETPLLHTLFGFESPLIICLLNVGTVSFIIFGRETAPGTGTVHLQGYLELPAKKALGGVKKLAGLGRAHLESARGSAEESITYCTKDDADAFRAGIPYDETGGRAGRESERQRWQDALDAARSDRVAEIPADLFIRYKRTFDEIASEARWQRAAAERPRIEYTLRPWQTSALDIIKGPVSDREVHFFVDPEGGAGKSFFCQNILRDVPDVKILRPGRAVDLAYILRDPPKCVVFDCPRATCYSDVPWEIVEGLKDGFICSTKYAGLTKSFCPATVLLMCNSELWKDVGGCVSLSEDRIKVHEISK